MKNWRDNIPYSLLILFHLLLGLFLCVLLFLDVFGYDLSPLFVIVCLFLFCLFAFVFQRSWLRFSALLLSLALFLLVVLK